MSDAENDKPTGRLIWLPEDLAITIFAALHAHRPSSRDEFSAAWDAAPADPAEAISRPLRYQFGAEYGPARIREGVAAVLAALGMPK